MRCKLCPPSARVPVVYAPLRFCREHFLAYYEKKVRHYFESTHLHDAKILIAVSGGKDSGALADILVKIKDEFRLELALFTINLRIPEYSEKGLAVAKELSERYALPLIVEDLAQWPRTIPEFVRPGAKPCSQCGTIKRYLLNKAAVERNFDCIATGHNLDDEFYFAMHSLLHRDVAQLRRSAKILPPKPEQKLAGRIKPLYYLTEKENRLYCLLNNVPHDADECPFSVDNPQIRFKETIGGAISRDEKKNLLKSLQELQTLQRQPPDTTAETGAREPSSNEKNNRTDESDNNDTNDDKNKYDDSDDDTSGVHPCPACGYPTTSDKSCAFCSLMTVKR